VNTLLEHITERLDSLFAQLAEGLDAPPAQRLRLEGLLEAAVLLGGASEDELTALLSSRYQAAFSRTPQDDFGAQWRQLFPFPQIPAMQQRAPVVPSTSDDL
tara:strand:- start:1060 stop:1365 length:306 start_codon:yes stop_codon:yes gene_type:complete